MFGYFSTHCLCAVANKNNVLCPLLLGTHSTFIVSLSVYHCRRDGPHRSVAEVAGAAAEVGGLADEGGHVARGQRVEVGVRASGGRSRRSVQRVAVPRHEVAT